MECSHWPTPTQTHTSHLFVHVSYLVRHASHLVVHNTACESFGTTFGMSDMLLYVKHLIVHVSHSLVVSSISWMCK